MILSPVSGTYWFVKTYIIMILLVPIVNVINERYSKYVLIFCVSLFSIVPTVCVQMPVFNNKIFIFVTLYIIASKFDDLKITLKSSMLLLIMSLFFIYLPIWVNGEIIERFDDIQSPFMVLAAVMLFHILSKCNFQNTVINGIANTTFICYLLHDNPSVRSLIWSEIFCTQRFYKSALWIVLIHILFCVVCIYLAAIMINLIYEKTVGKILHLRNIKLVCDCIDEFYNSLFFKWCVNGKGDTEK